MDGTCWEGMGVHRRGYTGGTNTRSVLMKRRHRGPCPGARVWVFFTFAAG